jgi:hypothetical protein
MQPSPSSETIVLSANASQGVTIDQVIVDTRTSVSGDGDVAAFRPCWRGQANTTFQQWLFGVSNNPASLSAELVTNAYGAPHASISFGSASVHFIQDSAFLGCRQGIWDLGHSGTMTLTVPNTSSGSATSYKYVRVQVTQYRDTLYNANAAVTISGATLVSSNQQTVLSVAPGRNWVVVQTILRVGPPTPSSETITITAGVNGGLIDQVVVDTLSLDFACPGTVTGNADLGQCSKANVTWTLPAVDGCLVTSVSSMPANGSTFAVGTTPVHSVITDGEGGTKTCDFNVVISDTQPPTVTCPANITVPKDPSQCGAFVTYTPTAMDNCSATAAGVPASGSLFPLGLTTVTCTATDATGNDSAPCTFNVRVVDFSGDVAGFVPCWRGQPNTTFQQWAFSVSNNPASLSAELVTNSYGTPSASISFGSASVHYIESSAFLGCVQGIWDLGHSGTMTLSVPNTSSGSAGSYKYARVQVMQYRDSLYNANATVSIPGATMVNSNQQTVLIVAGGRTWVVSQTVWKLGPPTPASESVVITAGINGALIDQVVVDTLSLDFACPTDIAGVTDPGQCSKANVTWVLPAVNGCTVTAVSSTPASGSTFAVGTTPVHSVITDGEGGTKTCDFNVVITDNQPPVISSTAATEVQPYTGVVNVMNCNSNTVQGTVNITVLASDQCPLSPPTVGLTNGVSGQLATFVNQSPAGTFNYTWTVTAGTANGTWNARVNASDTASTVTSSFTLCVDNSQITGQVDLENFRGNGVVPAHIRTVTFVATDGPGSGAAVLKTWDVPVLFDQPNTNVPPLPSIGNYTLTGIPGGTAGLSAKTAWNLRKKLPVTLSGGQATVNFKNAARLLGGDINHAAGTDNKVNSGDATFLNNHFGPGPANAPADIDGSGSVNSGDANFINNNFAKVGDPQ